MRTEEFEKCVGEYIYSKISGNIYKVTGGYTNTKNINDCTLDLVLEEGDDNQRLYINYDKATKYYELVKNAHTFLEPDMKAAYFHLRNKKFKANVIIGD